MGGGSAGTTSATSTASSSKLSQLEKKLAKSKQQWAEGYYADEVSGSTPATPATPRHASIFPNGGGGQPEAAEFASAAEFAARGRLYNDAGQIVKSLDHMANGSALYRAPHQPGTHFQWPAVRVGLKRDVPGLFSDNGEPVVLETLTDPGPDGARAGARWSARVSPLPAFPPLLLFCRRCRCSLL